MNDALRMSRKALTMTVVGATILWAMGLASIAPQLAQAATLSTGDLVRGSLPSVYYYGSDGKRYVFPNEKTYKTWYADFSGVKRISDAELASLPIGGNVTYRPGVKMVKITTDPKVYAVDKNGTLRWVKTEDIAKALYGNTWNQMIEDVPDAFFVNYTIGADVGDASQFDKAAAMAASSSIGTDKGLGTGPALPPVKGSVTVALATNTPPAAAIPSGAFYAPLSSYTLTNGTDRQVRLTGITNYRVGIASDSDISGILVTDQNGILHGSKVTFGQSVSTSGFASDPVMIAPGASATITVNVNIRSTASSGTIAVRLQSGDDLVVVDDAGTRIPVTGNFPLTGNLSSIVNNTTALGTLTLSARSIAGGTTTSPTLVDQGTKDLDVAKFRLQETTGNEDVDLVNLTIQNNGSASGLDFSNIRLIDQNGVEVAKVDQLVNNRAKFALAKPYRIPQGQLRDFTVRVDLSSNTNSASRTLNWTIQNDFEVRAIGVKTGVGVTITQLGGANAYDSFPIGDTFNVVQFRTGSLSLSRSSDSASGKLAQGATNVQIGKFDIRAFGEDAELQELNFVVKSTSTAGMPVGARVPSGTVKIVNDSGATIYSQTATDTNIYGSNTNFTIANNVVTTAAANGIGTLHILNTFYMIPVGTTKTLSFVVDIHQNAAASDSYTVAIQQYKIRRVSSNNFLTVGTAGTDIVTGNTLTIETSQLTVSRSSSFNPVTLVKGGATQKIGSFNLQAGAAEDQTVNSVRIKLCTASANATTNPIVSTVVASGDLTETGCTGATSLTNVANLTLRDGDTDLAPSSNITSTSGFTYSLQNFVIKANTTRTVDVYGVVNTAFAPTNAASGNATIGSNSFLAVALKVTSSVGSKSQATNTADETLGQGIRLTAAGNLSFTSLGRDGVINVAKLLHASETDVNTFKFQVRETTNAESTTVQKLYLGVRNGQNTFTDYKLYNADTNEKLGDTAQLRDNTGTTPNGGEVRFTGLSLLIPKGGVVNLLVKASTTDGSTIPTTAARSVQLGVTFVEFTGSSSGTTVRNSGGIASAVSSATNTISINDPSDFAALQTGETVQIDWDNDGAFATTSPFDETVAYQILTVDSVNKNITLTTNGTSAFTITSGMAAAFVPGGRVTTDAFTSEIHNVEEVEPVITAMQVGEGNQIIENPIGTFKIEAVGAQPLSLTKLRFEVSGSYNYNATSSKDGFAPRRFRLDRADPTTGARIANTLTNTGVLAGGRLVYTASGDTTGLQDGTAGGTALAGCGTATGTKGATTVTLGSACTAGLAVGDRVTFVGDTNDGVGYRVTAGATGTTLTVTPALRAGFTGVAMSKVNSFVAVDTTDTAILESGQVIQFAFTTTEQVPVNGAKAYTLLADTTNIKDNSSTGTTATTTVRILGSKAIQDTSNGLSYTYTRTSTGTSSGTLTLSDSYIVTGRALTYL